MDLKYDQDPLDPLANNQIPGLSDNTNATTTRGPITEDFAAAAALAQPFMITMLVMRFRYPPTDASWARADPILKLLPRDPTMWLVPLFGVALTIVLLVLAWPSWSVIKRALIWGVIGAVVAGGAVALIFKLHGSHLPRFIPREESAAAGLSLGMMAGYAEEIFFRVGVLPLVFLHLSARSRFVAVALASIITGLVFALLHEPGSTDAFSPTFFAVRFLVPGLVMSVLALVTKPSFIVGLHCTAHVLIPMFFV